MVKFALAESTANGNVPLPEIIESIDETRILLKCAITICGRSERSIRYRWLRLNSPYRTAVQQQLGSLFLFVKYTGNVVQLMSGQWSFTLPTR